MAQDERWRSTLGDALSWEPRNQHTSRVPTSFLDCLFYFNPAYGDIKCKRAVTKLLLREYIKAGRYGRFLFRHGTAPCTRFSGLCTSPRT